jgi:hypothetical protein
MNKYEAAARYLKSRGICPCRVKYGTKQPEGRWKSLQNEMASDDLIRRWFAKGESQLGVVCGKVSGNLVVRDFDKIESYDRWAIEHSDLAAKLPTVATSRARHVYARERGTETGIVTLDDGELRGNGAIVVAPPSRHPSGAVYQWIVPLNGELPVVDLESSGFLQCDRVDGDDRGSEKTLSRSTVCSPSSLSTLSTLSSLSHEQELAIAKTLPTGFGQRARCLFDLAREVKTIMPNASQAELRDFLRHWHRAALPKIRTKDFAESWIDFNKAMAKVLYPAGQDPIESAFAVAAASIPPAAAVAISSNPKVHLLAALCAELQRIAGTEQFYLDCRTAGRLLDVDHSTANRWLYLLNVEGIVREESKGSHETHRASRFRYVAQ